MKWPTVLAAPFLLTRERKESSRRVTHGEQEHRHDNVRQRITIGRRVLQIRRHVLVMGHRIGKHHQQNGQSAKLIQKEKATFCFHNRLLIPWLIVERF